jgi:hypothetical protein
LTDVTTADSRIAQAERRLVDLQVEAQFSAMRDRLENMDTRLGQLPAVLADLRRRGYVFRNDLEERAAGLAKSWPATRRQVQAMITQRAADLAPELRAAVALMRTLQPLKARPLTAVESTVAAAEARLDDLARRVAAAAQTVAGMFDTAEKELRALDDGVSDADHLLDEMAAATFAWQPGECGVSMVEAEQLGDRKEDTLKGILFLTDRRLIMERVEKVATKKVLFITTKSELVRELLWEASIDLLEGVEATEERHALILTHELLNLSFKRQAKVERAALRLKADSETWRGLIARVRSGPTRRSGWRPGRGDAAVALPRAAKCPGCGASLSLAGEVRGRAPTPVRPAATSSRWSVSRAARRGSGPRIASHAQIHSPAPGRIGVIITRSVRVRGARSSARHRPSAIAGFARYHRRIAKKSDRIALMTETPAIFPTICCGSIASPWSRVSSSLGTRPCEIEWISRPRSSIAAWRLAPITPPRPADPADSCGLSGGPGPGRRGDRGDHL